MIQFILQALLMMLNNSYIMAAVIVFITILVLCRPDAQQEHRQV